MNKEEFLKAIENVPKTDSINSISAYNSINVEDLANAVDRFKKVPTYDELLKENQELNQKYLNAVADYETTMSELQELKKQLEYANEELELVRCDLHNRTSERDGYYRNIEILENQQKEFIEYMNKTIEELECDDVDDEEIKGYLIQRIDTFKEILNKYKEIIGDKE